MTFTSWERTFPPITPPHIDEGASAVAPPASGAPGQEVIPDPFFDDFNDQTGIPSFSSTSPTFYLDDDGNPTSPIGWYTATPTTGFWSYSTDSDHPYGLPALTLQSSSPPVLRPRTYDSTSNPIGGFAAMARYPMYYEWEIDMKVDSTAGTPTAGVQMRFADWNASTSAVASTAVMVALTTAYQRLATSGVVPEIVPGSTARQAIHLMPEVITAGTTGLRTWFFADASLTLQVDEPLRYFLFSQGGNLSTGTGTFKVPFTSPGTIKTVRAAVGTAPQGAEITLDVNKNSTTIYGSTSVAAPTVSTNATIGANADPDPTTMAAGDWLTIDIDQVGSATPGADLVVTVEWRAQ